MNLFRTTAFLFSALYGPPARNHHSFDRLDGGLGAGPPARDRNRRYRGQGHHHHTVDIGRVAQAVESDRDSGDDRWNAEGEIGNNVDRSEQRTALVRRG